jgi:hypothetical protein
MRFLLLLALLLFVTAPLARPPILGDEVSGEAYVVWKAVVDKVSQTQPYGVSVKAKLELQGRTREGNQIRGTGVLRFIGDSNETFAVGDALQGNDSLRYWTTVKSLMGSDLAIIEGVAILNFATTDGVETTEGAVKLKAAVELF